MIRHGPGAHSHLANRPLAAGLTLALAVLACTLPSPDQAQQRAGLVLTTLATTEAGSPSQTSPPPTLPLATALPSNTPPPTLTSTPSVPIALPKDQPVNCRYGPDVGWEATSGLTLGTAAEIAGKNSQNTWWYVKDPLNAGQFCWVSMSVTDSAGNLASVPTVAGPVASVSRVTVNADVAFTACGGPNVIAFSGLITTTGPTTVEYRWEVRGDKENTTPPETLVFESFGARQAQDPGAYTADCGDYSITLHVLSPNDISAEDEFSVEP
jgi:hypothetical protein